MPWFALLAETRKSKSLIAVGYGAVMEGVPMNDVIMFGSLYTAWAECGLRIGVERFTAYPRGAGDCAPVIVADARRTT